MPITKYLPVLIIILKSLRLDEVSGINISLMASLRSFLYLPSFTYVVK
ncbi:hypothetical protein ACFLUS_05170 [Chloroflexota bacterium]